MGEKLKEKKVVQGATTLPGFGHHQQEHHRLRGKTGDLVLNHAFLAPCGCKLDASRDIPFPARSTRPTHLIALPIPGLGERHTVSNLPFFPALREPERCAKPRDGDDRGRYVVTSAPPLRSCSGSPACGNLKFRATLLSRNSCVSVTSMNYG